MVVLALCWVWKCNTTFLFRRYTHSEKLIKYHEALKNYIDLLIEQKEGKEINENILYKAVSNVPSQNVVPSYSMHSIVDKKI